MFLLDHYAYTGIYESSASSLDFTDCAECELAIPLTSIVFINTVELSLVGTHDDR